LKKIILADDDPTIRLLVNATLRSDEYELIEASNGEEALALAQKEKPDLILLDVAMPKLDGFQVCRQLKSDPATNFIHVIMLTARAQETDRQRGEEAGADDYFTKPFSPLALLDKISDVLG
jgi:two-component system alkaline phosphatase synthesis response regulator PhoP